MAAKKRDPGVEIVKPATAAITKFDEGLQVYLGNLGLPVEGVLVSPMERAKVLMNAPTLVALVQQSDRQGAMYISKFIAACGAGLFDAALNFLWDEVVVRLRTRVARFDLTYFYDTAVQGAERDQYKDEADLADLADVQLIKGAERCGMITELGFKHLDYIREMRNWASAAHPNQAELTGLQLVAWFETCLKEVILREPEGAVLEVQRLLTNLRQQTLRPGDVPAITTSIGRLPTPLASALLRSIAGLYADPRQTVAVRDNVRLVARAVWIASSDAAKNEIGLKYANFSANGDVDRKTLTHEFLEHVEGLAHLPESDLVLELQQRIADLESAHFGYNNFHNEPRPARELRKFIPPTGVVPAQVNDQYVEVVVRCAVGRFSGISRAAAPTYDEMIDLFQEVQIREVVYLLWDQSMINLLGHSVCAARFQNIIKRLLPKAVGQTMQTVLGIIASWPAAVLPGLHKDARFQQLVKLI